MNKNEISLVENIHLRFWLIADIGLNDSPLCAGADIASSARY